MNLRVLKGTRKGKVACEACGRVVTAGRRHKAGLYLGWCKGYVSEAEKSAKSFFVAASRALSRFAQQAERGEITWWGLECASKKALEACGVDPKTVPPLERFTKGKT